MNTIPRALKRLKMARTVLIMDHPFFGALCVRLKLVEALRSETRTFATDGRCICYDSSYVDRRSDDELVGILAHEVMHCALRHHTRRGERDPNRWNEAADYAINPILKDAGLTLPDGVLIEDLFRGMSAEQIYEALPPPTPGDKPPDLADRPGAVLDAPDPVQEDAEWQVAVKQAAQAALMIGRLPDGVKVAVEEAAKPRIDWRAALRRFVQYCADADYSWQRPDRRYTAFGLYLPSLQAESLPPIVVAVDTSGSTEEILPVFAAELQSIVDECQPQATIVVMADAAVHRVDRFERGEDIAFDVQGLGGTDFRPTFEYVEREESDVACLIYLTDGDGRYPKLPSAVPTLWAVTDPSIHVPWGDVIHIHLD
jgi:predicted metal-dependent peptidase